MKFNKEIFFEFKEGLLISLQAIRSNKIRSVLTTLGIVIGVWAVITMSTAIRGINISFQNGVSSLGSDNLYIDKWAWFNNDIPWWELRNRKDITMRDFEKYKSQAKLPLAIAPTAFTRKTIKQKDNSVDFIMITGTTNGFIKTTNLTFSEGRFFNGLESKGSRNVIVLGSSIAERLFPHGGAIDSYVKIKGLKLKVVGVLAKQGSWVMGDFNPDNRVYLPIGFMFKNLRRESQGGVTIDVRSPNSAMVDKVKDEAIEILRRVRGLHYFDKNNFSINQQAGLLTTIDQTVGVIQIGGLFITGLALFVGAIGIMNIMFVSVKERTKEIGIRKAIGAKNRSILGQFIAESAFICFLGGLIGLALALLTALIINQFMPTSIQASAVITAIVISLLTGILSGFAPAYTAAKMDPVDALRYE